MKFSKKDKLQIYELYNNFLKNLVDYTRENHQYSILNAFCLFQELIEKGKFSGTNQFISDMYYTYLHIDDMKVGMQVMNGVCCCRHVNELLNDFLRTLGYDTDSISIYLDEDVLDFEAEKKNHVAVWFQDNTGNYLLDAYNGFALKFTDNQTMESIDLPINENNQAITDYNNQNIPRAINKILTKYYHLRELGITRINDYHY